MLPTNDQEDDDRDLWGWVDSIILNATDRQRRRGMDREPLENMIERPIMGTPFLEVTADINGMVAEQSQLKEDIKHTTAANNALYAVVKAQSRQLKKNAEEIKILKRKVTALEKK